MTFRTQAYGRDGLIAHARNVLDYIKATKGGTSAEYLSRRIALDRPNTLADRKTGKFSSIGSAAKAAGMMNEPTALQRVQHA